MRALRPSGHWWLALLGVVLVTACVQTETIFVERPLYEDAPTAAAGFLGYTNPTSKLPVCGNCHVGMNAEWKGTRHARAWQDLQANANRQASCEGCHTVGSLGNRVTNPNVGYAATRDARYHDVQCESCHGPGLEHVTNPDATQPLASILVGTDLTSGCGECHRGTHNPFIEEWSQSAHAKVGTSPQRNASCVGCHEARGIFAGWNVKADYLEKAQTDPIPIGCPVCHDPHDATNGKQLRFPINVADVERNLCMKCHHRRSVPDLARASSGPHSPQGPLLIGEGVGWLPPNFAYAGEKIIGSHGTGANPRLCAGCHVSRLEVTDPATGGFVLNATGHLFKAIACLDNQGRPTTSDNCTLSQRTFKSCTAAGCHGSETAARSALNVARTRLDGLVATLNALLARVPASEFNNNDNRFTTAEGAKFNASLGAMKGSSVHNPFLVEALLTSSIRQIEVDYGLRPTQPIVLDNLLDPGH